MLQTTTQYTRLIYLLTFALLVTSGYMPFHKATHLVSAQIESGHYASVDNNPHDSHHNHHHGHEKKDSLNGCDICLLLSGLNAAFQTTHSATLLDPSTLIIEPLFTPLIIGPIRFYQSRAPPLVS